MFFFSFLFFLLWSGSGTSREVVSALNSRADVTSLLVIVSTFFLVSPFVLTDWFTENLSIYLSPPAPNSPLQNPSNFGATASHWILYFLLLFFFFLIFNPMYAWSLMRGDAFIHFVCGSRRVNIQLGVLLLIPKSPQSIKYLYLAKEQKKKSVKHNNDAYGNGCNWNSPQGLRKKDRRNWRPNETQTPAKVVVWTVSILHLISNSSCLFFFS